MMIAMKLDGLQFVLNRLLQSVERLSKKKTLEKEKKREEEKKRKEIARAIEGGRKAEKET